MMHNSDGFPVIVIVVHIRHICMQVGINGIQSHQFACICRQRMTPEHAVDTTVFWVLLHAISAIEANFASANCVLFDNVSSTAKYHAQAEWAAKLVHFHGKQLVLRTLAGSKRHEAAGMH
jgi:hypothetical protein